MSPVSRSRAVKLRRGLPNDPDPTQPLVGALLRFAWNRVNERIFIELAAAGYGDLNSSYLRVFRFPAPEGERPADLAKRSGITKQAMNYILGQLAELGYLERAPSDGAVTLTKRGWKVAALLRDIVRRVEREWAMEVGAEDFSVFMRVLRAVATQ